MRFVVCGEALIDLIPEADSSSNPSTWTAYSGGGPLNTAVALSRLGAETQFLGRMGDDAFAAQLRRHLMDNDVLLDFAVDTDEPTSLAVVSLDGEGKARYTFHFDGTSNFGWRISEFPVLTEDDWLHFGSISAIGAPGSAAIREFVRGTQASVSYDINVRPSVQPDMERYFEEVTGIMRLVGDNGGIVKASDEDISLLVGEDEDPIGFAHAWVEEFGLSLFLLTLGADGAVACLSGEREVRVDGYEIELADTVGAGDTFMAGFLLHYVDRPDDIEAALRGGVAAAALVCTQHGAHPPAFEDLMAFLEQR